MFLCTCPGECSGYVFFRARARNRNRSLFFFDYEYEHRFAEHEHDFFLHNDKFSFGKLKNHAHPKAATFLLGKVFSLIIHYF